MHADFKQDVFLMNYINENLVANVLHYHENKIFILFYYFLFFFLIKCLVIVG